MKFIGKGPVININASRGCPYSCFYYCVYPLQQGRKLRLKSPEKLLNEMIYFNDNLNVKNFIFRDPVFSINKEHTKAVCQKIIECTNPCPEPIPLGKLLGNVGRIEFLLNLQAISLTDCLTVCSVDKHLWFFLQLSFGARLAH